MVVVFLIFRAASLMRAALVLAETFFVREAFLVVEEVFVFGVDLRTAFLTAAFLGAARLGPPRFNTTEERGIALIIQLNYFDDRHFPTVRVCWGMKKPDAKHRAL